MTSINFPETNCFFGPPPDLSDTQVKVIHAYQGPITQGSTDGERMTIVAWQPTAEETEAIRAGAPIYLTFMGGLPPHMVTTSFKDASNPA